MLRCIRRLLAARLAVGHGVRSVTSHLKVVRRAPLLYSSIFRQLVPQRVVPSLGRVLVDNKPVSPHKVDTRAFTSGATRPKEEKEKNEKDVSADARQSYPPISGFHPDLAPVPGFVRFLIENEGSGILGCLVTTAAIKVLYGVIGLVPTALFSSGYLPIACLVLAFPMRLYLDSKLRSHMLDEVIKQRKVSLYFLLELASTGAGVFMLYTAATFAQNFPATLVLMLHATGLSFWCSDFVLRVLRKLKR